MFGPTNGVTKPRGTKEKADSYQFLAAAFPAEEMLGQGRRAGPA